MPRNYSVSVLSSELEYLDNFNDTEFRHSLIDTIQNREDLQRHLLASSEVGQSIQDDIDIIVTDGRLNNVRVKHMLYRVHKNGMYKQNPFETVFKISKFEVHNPIIGRLLSKIESGKLTDESVKRFLNKLPNSKDIELKSLNRKIPKK